MLRFVDSHQLESLLLQQRSRCGAISAEGRTAIPMTITFWPSSLASRDAAFAATAALPLPVGLHDQRYPTNLYGSNVYVYVDQSLSGDRSFPQTVFNFIVKISVRAGLHERAASVGQRGSCIDCAASSGTELQHLG